AALVSEATHPQVEMDFEPSSLDFKLFDSPAYSDGTEASDKRQVEFDLSTPYSEHVPGEPPTEREASVGPLPGKSADDEVRKPGRRKGGKGRKRTPPSELEA